MLALGMLTAVAAAAPASAQVPVPVGQPGQSEPSAQQSQASAPSYRRLSDERRLSRWAHAVARARVRAKPARSARTITRLRYETEDGFPEVYLALLSYQAADGQRWVQVRLPMRPNGRKGWVPRSALGAFHVTRQRLVLSRRRLRLTFYQRGRKRWSAPVGIGKRGTPTPAGHFWVRERIRVRNPSSGYWPYAFGTSAYSRLTDWPGGGVVGIHGPYYAESRIPGRISHGCIRLRRRDDWWLGRHLGIGTPLLIK